MVSGSIIQRVRKVLEKGYTDQCSVRELRQVKREDFSTTHTEVEIYKNIPCRLSFQMEAVTKNNALNATKKQVIKIFLSPKVKIKPGSKIQVTSNEETTDYECSSKPKVYATHQEVVLELFGKWA